MVLLLDMANPRPPRMHLYLPLEVQEDLKAVAESEGISISELVRRVLGDWRDQHRQNATSELKAYTHEEMRLFLANRVLELSRLAIRLERDVLEIEDSAKKEGLSVLEYVKKQFGVDII